MKVITVMLAIFLIVLCGWLAYHYNQTAFKAQDVLNQERFTRMTAEENLEKAKDRINSLEAEVSKSQNKINGLEKMVEQTKAINEDLKSRMDKALAIKDNLESKIKELQASAGVSSAPAAAITNSVVAPAEAAAGQ